MDLAFQLFACIFMIAVLFIWYKSSQNPCVEKKEDEDISQQDGDNNQEKHEKFFIFLLKSPISTLIFVFGGILLINLIVTFAQNTSLIIESPLTYSDTLLMLISLSGDIVIAVLTYRIQQKIDREAKFEDNAEKRQHWISERFRCIKYNENSTCYAVNLKLNPNILKDTTIYNIQDSTDRILLIKIANCPNSHHSLFYPHNFSIIKKELKINGYILPQEYWDVHSDDITITLKRDYYIDNFLLFPILQDKSISSPILRFKLDLAVEEEGLFSASYTISFSLCPLKTYGYDKNGSFILRLSDHSVYINKNANIELCTQRGN